MSHFCVYVFTKEDGMDIEEIMAPYSEGLPCAPHVEYTKEQAVAQIREEIKQYENTVYARYLADPEGYAEESQNEAHVNYVKNEFPKKLAYTDEECYEEMKERFDEDMIDEEGNLYTSYNPYSKWDWYTEGGRWKNVLCGKNGLCVNSAPVGAIDFEKSPIPFAYVTPSGIWFENGQMGWFGAVANEQDADKWEKQFKDYVKKLDGQGASVTVLDCHI